MKVINDTKIRSRSSHACIIWTSFSSDRFDDGLAPIYR